MLELISFSPAEPQPTTSRHPSPAAGIMMLNLDVGCPYLTRDISWGNIYGEGMIDRFIDKWTH